MMEEEELVARGKKRKLVMDGEKEVYWIRKEEEVSIGWGVSGNIR